jgi:hypothetical protein
MKTVKKILKFLNEYKANICKIIALSSTVIVFVFTSGKSLINWEYYVFLASLAITMMLYEYTGFKRGCKRASTVNIISEIQAEIRKQAIENAPDDRSQEEIMNSILEQIANKGVHTLDEKQKEFLKNY